MDEQLENAGVSFGSSGPNERPWRAVLLRDLKLFDHETTCRRVVFLGREPVLVELFQICEIDTTGRGEIWGDCGHNFFELT